MEYRVFGDCCVLRVQKGEEILESIKKLCEKEKIALATVSGIGATDRVTVGVFDTNNKVYNSTELRGTFEITSLLGNITQKDGDVYIHTHITVADGERVYGGHLNAAQVSATAEIFITRINGRVGRRFDADSGLNLFEF